MPKDVGVIFLLISVIDDNVVIVDKSISHTILMPQTFTNL
jgi:hypothetical protein